MRYIHPSQMAHPNLDLLIARKNADSLKHQYADA
jgi:hypothetical protein